MQRVESALATVPGQWRRSPSHGASPESGRHKRARNTNLLVGRVRVLVAAVEEELVLLDGQADRSTRGVPVQLRILFIRGNIRIGIEEIRIGVQPIRSAMHVGSAVNVVCAGRGAHVDVRTAGPALLRVIHRSVHAHFRNRFRSWRRNGFANRKINGSAALDRNGTESGSGADTSVIHDARGIDLRWCSCR